MSDRKKVIEQLESMRDYHRSVGNNITADIANDALKLLKEQPEIVRCKDCENNIGGRCRNLDLWVETDPDWFCADGERRKNDDR